MLPTPSIESIHCPARMLAYIIFLGISLISMCSMAKRPTGKKAKWQKGDCTCLVPEIALFHLAYFTCIMKTKKLTYARSDKTMFHFKYIDLPSPQIYNHSHNSLWTIVCDKNPMGGPPLWQTSSTWLSMAVADPARYLEDVLQSHEVAGALDTYLIRRELFMAIVALFTRYNLIMNKESTW